MSWWRSFRHPTTQVHLPEDADNLDSLKPPLLIWSKMLLPSTLCQNYYEVVPCGLSFRLRTVQEKGKGRVRKIVIERQGDWDRERERERERVRGGEESLSTLSDSIGHRLCGLLQKHVARLWRDTLPSRRVNLIALPSPALNLSACAQKKCLWDQ